MTRKIIIAVPRGRIIKECKKLLNKTTFAPDPLLFDEKTRKLTFGSKDPNIDYIKNMIKTHQHKRLTSEQIKYGTELLENAMKTGCYKFN